MKGVGSANNALDGLLGLTIKPIKTDTHSKFWAPAGKKDRREERNAVVETLGYLTVGRAKERGGREVE